MIQAEFPPQPMKFNQHGHPIVNHLLQEFKVITSPLDLAVKKDPESRVFHRIETGDAPPIYYRTRRLPEDKLRVAREEFSILLKAGVVRPSKSPWSTPFTSSPRRPPASGGPAEILEHSTL